MDEKVHICGPVVNLCYICVNSFQYEVIDVLLLFHPSIHHSVLNGIVLHWQSIGRKGTINYSYFSKMDTLTASLVVTLLHICNTAKVTKAI